MLRNISRQAEEHADVRLLGRMRPVLRHKFVFVVVVLLCGAGAYGLSRLQTPTYSATSVLLFRDSNTSPSFLGQTQPPAVDPTQQAATDLRLASLPRIASLVARQFPHISRQRISSETTVAPQGQSNVIGITVVDPDPKLAAKLATAYAREAITVRRQADQATLLQTLKLVQASFARLPADQKASSYGRQLQSEASQLSILASLQTGQAELVQTAQTPTTPSSLGTKVYVGLGLLVGLVLAYVLSTLLDRLDRRVHTVEELTGLFGQPTMGFVPRGLRPARDRDAFNVIRTNLRYVPARPVRSVLMTSTEPQEGKTTIALNLASAAAAAGTPCLLIEADLRRPALAHRRRLDAEAGLSDCLTGRARWQDAVVRAHALGGANADLDVLLAGPVPPNPSDLLASNEMARLLAEAVEHYALVVVDCSPIGIVPDAVSLATICDATLVVIRLKRARRHHVRAVLTRLQDIGVGVIGLVANFCEETAGYGYGYGYDYRQAHRPGDMSKIEFSAAGQTSMEDPLPFRRV